MDFDSGIDGAVLLDDVGAFVRRFLVMSRPQQDAIALWVLHTHAIDAAEATPYLTVTSALKRSGKTLLLEVVELLVSMPLPTMNISDAALFRAVDELRPTLLFDEVDAIFGTRARDREDLRGMLNAGYRRGAIVYRMGGPNMRALESFSVFCTKAFAGIGTLPDTIADRAILIRFERRTRKERIERFRRRDVEPEATMLRDRLADWAVPQLEELRSARPVLPDELDDRAQDIWEPLLAIADLAGGDWPGRARAAAVVLSNGDAREDDSLNARLIADIHTVFNANGTQRYKTSDLIAELCKVEESPWGDWHGKPITPQAVSRLLKPFRIQTMTVKADGGTVRGYKVEQFTDAFHRVLGVTSVSGVTSRMAAGAAGNGGNAGSGYPRGDLGEDIPLP